MVAAHIWFAPDDGSDGLTDPTFGEPERVVRDHPFHGFVGDPEYAPEQEMGDSSIDSEESNDNGQWGVMVGGGGVRKGTNVSPDAKDSVEMMQKAYSTEAGGYSGEVKSDSRTATATDVSEDQSDIIAKETPNDTSTDEDAPINETKTHHRTDMLIEALQPITFNECCIPAVQKDTHNPANVDCFGTCYNERACTDPIYPFNSAEEKAMLPMAHHTPQGRKELKRKCKSPKKPVPPVEWCQKPPTVDETTNNETTAAHLVEGIPPAGCTAVTSGGGSGPFQHVILFPSAKLAFCGIPKVGITQWEQFLRFYIGAKDYPALPHYKLDRNFFQFDKLDPMAQRRIWED